jgi:hypothetical protein
MGITTNFSWDYGTQNQTPWWTVWTGVIQDIDTELYGVKLKTNAWVDVRSFGASPSASATVNTAAIQAAVNSLSGNPGIIVLPEIYPTNDTITVSNHRQYIISLGRWVGGIVFNPTAHDKPAIRFQKSTAVPIVQNGIRDLVIMSSDTTYRKIGIDLVDVSEFSWNDVAISQMVDSSYSSIGLRFKGRDTSSFINPHIVADIPVRVSKNPNISTIDIDCTNFHNTYFVATSTNPNFLIDDGCYLSNLSFTGSNIWAAGGHGFYYSDTTTAGQMYNLSIDNLRWEQSTNATGYIVYSSSAYWIQNVKLRGVHGGGSNRGFYFRRAGHLTLENVGYFGSGVALDVTEVGGPIIINNFYNPSGSISTGSLTLTETISGGSGNSIVRALWK